MTRENILVVDDDKGLLEQAKNCLGLLRFNVYTATCKEDAKEVMENNKDIKYILTDVNLEHDENAMHILELAQSYARPTKLLAWTGGNGSSLEKKVTGFIGKNNLLSKPIKYANLAELFRDSEMGYYVGKRPGSGL